MSVCAPNVLCVFVFMIKLARVCYALRSANVSRQDVMSHDGSRDALAESGFVVVAAWC